MTTPRLPTASDLGTLTYTLTPAPSSKSPQNLLILLHGLGDTHTPFATLGSNLNLPETACLSIRAPATLPFEIPGYHWGDDIVFDQGTGGLDGDSGFRKTREVMGGLIGKLVGECGWEPRKVFFLGFKQGGMVALDIAAGARGREVEYGGVVSIGGGLPSDLDLDSGGKKGATPVLVLAAERNSAVGKKEEGRVRAAFEAVQVVRWMGRDGDGMMRTREEARPVMEFFARRLRSRAGVPEGAVEL